MFVGDIGVDCKERGMGIEEWDEGDEEVEDIKHNSVNTA